MSKLNLSQLAAKLYWARREENEKKKERIRIEEEILKLVDIPINTSKTINAGDLKLMVKRELSYSVEEEALFGAGLPDEWIEQVFSKVPETLKFEPRRYEKLQELEPEAYKEVSKYVTTKERKPSVAIKL